MWADDIESLKEIIIADKTATETVLFDSSLTEKEWKKLNERKK